MKDLHTWEHTDYDASMVREARPDDTYNSAPHYPSVLRKKGVEGVVWLKVLVSKQGHAAEISFVKRSGHRLFDESALRAVKQW